MQTRFGESTQYLSVQALAPILLIDPCSIHYRVYPSEKGAGIRMNQRDKTAALKRFLLGHAGLLNSVALYQAAAEFERQTGLTASKQSVANVADRLALKRRRKRGPVPTRTGEEKLESKRTRQRNWLRKKRQNSRSKASARKEALVLSNRTETARD